MFDVGMGEIGLIAIVALLVLGPERLPGAARTAGALLRKARQSWQNVRVEIERELAAEELKRSIKQTAAAADPTAEVRDAMHSIMNPQPTTPSTPASGEDVPPAAAPDTHERR
jgi:sec-independent protein translocase protein TatB